VQVHAAVGAQVASQLITIPPPLFRSSQGEVAAHLLPAQTSPLLLPSAPRTSRRLSWPRDEWRFLESGALPPLNLLCCRCECAGQLRPGSEAAPAEDAGQVVLDGLGAEE
jgi:hypothetical protein